MSDIILFDNKVKCCGCAACADVCPRNAIEMKNDEFGFSIPVIDNNKCIHCKKCLSVCQYKIDLERYKPFEVYASATNNMDLLKHTASGGCFSALAKSVVSNGGAVVGCAYDYNKHPISVQHELIDNDVSLQKLMGSKYVQSNTEGIYRKIKKIADTNKTVLFSGTPCQVAACRLALGTQYDNVYYVDIICHGVPSQKMFQDYLLFLENKLKIRIKDITFRDKEKGWGLHGSLVFQKGKSEYKKIFKTGGSSYYSMFLNSHIYRDSCYNCRYACSLRPGDITIGDYWGVEKKHPEYLRKCGGQLDEDKGISCLLINTNKGKELIEKYGSELIMLPSSFENVADNNKQLNSPSKISDIRNDILMLFKDSGYLAVDKWFYKHKGLKSILYKIDFLLPAKKINIKKKNNN